MAFFLTNQLKSVQAAFLLQILFLSVSFQISFFKFHNMFYSFNFLYICCLSCTLKLRRGAFTMINEKHDCILNGPRVLLLRDKFNKLC